MGKRDGKKHNSNFFFFRRASIKRRQFSTEQREMSLKAFCKVDLSKMLWQAGRRLS